MFVHEKFPNIFIKFLLTLLLTEHTIIIEVAKPTKIALMYVKVLPLTNMRYISGWVVNVYRLLMVRDINYSVRKCLPLADGAGYKLFSR